MVRGLYTRPDDAKDQWRVHVAAAGFGELNRIIEPLRVLPCDAFYLLQHPRNDRSVAWYAQRGIDVLKEVRKAGIRRARAWKVDLWHAPGVGNFLARQLRQEGFSRLDVNVSSGPKTVGIGATLASLFWPVELYYGDVDYDAADAPGQDDPWGPPFVGIQRIPTFHTEAPRNEMLQALKVLGDRSESVGMRELKTILQEGPDAAIRPRGRGENQRLTPQAVHSQFQNIIRPLKERRLVDEVLEFRQKRFSITAQGRATYALFQGM